MRRKVTCETHYEYGFDVDVSATGNPSMFLKGGNDSNFGMVMTVMRENSSAFEDDTELGPTNELERFQPARVTFYVRTDSPDSGAPPRRAPARRARARARAQRRLTRAARPRPPRVPRPAGARRGAADAGHFILGESNEVNRRVAQFQFTKDGNMGLLGSGGASYGAVPYEPFTWYRIDLTFHWERKEVRAPTGPCARARRRRTRGAAQPHRAGGRGRPCAAPGDEFTHKDQPPDYSLIDSL